MVAPKCHTRCLLVGGLVLIGLAVLVASSGAADEREPAGSEERLHALLTERYEIRRKAVESLQPFVDSGRVGLGELSACMTAMYLAEADLCTTDAARIKVHEKLVAMLRKHEELARRRADAGRMSEWEVDKGRADTVDAQIALERLRLGQHPVNQASSRNR